MAENIELFRQKIGALSELTEEEWDFLIQKTTFRKINKKEFIVKKGETCKSVVFLLDGILRLYNTDMKKELTHEIFHTPRFVTDMVSFKSGEKSIFYIDAIVDSVIAEISFDIVYELIYKSASFQKVYQKSMEDAIIGQQFRINELLNTDVKSRYEKFINEFGKTSALIPQKIIASYLGITPEAFSRLKKNIYENNA